MKNDPVTWPAHYNTGNIEVIDFINDQKLSFCGGQVVKYVARAGKKTKSKEVEDLQKALFYLQMEIHIQGGGPDPRDEREDDS